MKPNKDWIEQAKRKAAVKAVQYVKDGFVVGLGSGSTAAYAIKEIGKRIKHEQLHVFGIPTSYQALLLAVENKIPIVTLEEHPVIDVTIDGADQIDNSLNLIKGNGGALTKEKVVASASKRLIIVADESKKVEILGENNHPIPIEVIPFATPFVKNKIKENGGESTVREGVKKVGPVITDNGNMIIDATFGFIRNPKELDQKLRSIPGVIETGLFVGMVDEVYLGKRSGVEKLLQKR